MITFSEQQIIAWISPILWPFLRVLALFTVAPVFSLRSIPMRAKVALAFLVALAAQPSLELQPLVSMTSPEAGAVVVQQVLVGLSVGFAVRLVFACVELAGELIGLQMGLNFAAFFDPASGTQTSAVSRFMGHMSVLLFVVVNGHLMLVMALIKTFELFPVGANVLAIIDAIKLHRLGADLFATAFWIALPVISLLLFVNLMLGIVSRVAPQMNIFAVGFPVTLTLGLVGVMLTMPMLDHPVMVLLERVLTLFTRA